MTKMRFLPALPESERLNVLETDCQDRRRSNRLRPVDLGQEYSHTIAVSSKILILGWSNLRSYFFAVCGPSFTKLSRHVCECP